jgi:hypothetical protein
MTKEHVGWYSCRTYGKRSGTLTRRAYNLEELDQRRMAHFLPEPTLGPERTECKQGIQPASSGLEDLDGDITALPLSKMDRAIAGWRRKGLEPPTKELNRNEGNEGFDETEQT